jgi:hypothetical protein
VAVKQESNRISREALKVRSEIVVQCKEHCFDLTPEQVQTVIDLYNEHLLTADCDYKNHFPEDKECGVIGEKFNERIQHKGSEA